MAQQIFAYILHKDGVIDDTAMELVAAARQLDPSVSATAIVAGSGQALTSVSQAAAASYPEVWKIEKEDFAYIIADEIRAPLARILPQGSLVLIPHEHFGMDLAPGLSIKMNASFLPDALAFEGIEGGKLRAVREEFNGQVSTHVQCDVSQGAVITVRPGAFKADESKGADGQVVDKSAEALDGVVSAMGRRYLEVVEAEVGDVDITKSDILVSVGRGIEDEDNLEIIHELAAAMGGDVSCSRPIVDAKWLEKARQVGTSGKTVKPKVYLALGISGSFQHMGGIKGAPFMVAVNKNAKAPIFQMADVGVVADILEFLPELTDKIKASK